MMFVIRNSTILRNCLGHLSVLPTNKIWDVKIEEHKASRSTQQNRLYWEWMTILGDETGLSKEDMHATFSIRLLGPEVFFVDGKQYVRARSTTSLTTKEFSEYLDQISATAMAMEIRLPRPADRGME